ncbi:hypothetical protein GCM10008915_30330 [Bifidobacterium pullorum subsp. gallinarum]
MGTCYSHLSPDERIRIERLHCEQGLSVRETARLIGRDKATVSRDLKRGLWFASNENESHLFLVKLVFRFSSGIFFGFGRGCAGRVCFIGFGVCRT